MIYLKAAKRVGLKCSHNKKEMVLCDVMSFLANAVVVIISQYISVSKPHIVYLKFTQCYTSIMSQRSWKYMKKK